MKEQLEALGRQLIIGVGQVATRAIAAGAKSAIRDVERVGDEVRRRARRARTRLDEMLGDRVAGRGPEMSNWDDEED